MSTEQVLLTGGAGFIGSFVADELLAHGYRIRAIDCLAPQVHGDVGRPPEYLDERVDLRIGDIRNAEFVRDCLQDVTSVVHLAAAVGVGQSMYQIEKYTSANNLGTAVLLEALTDFRVERLVVASSMSLYGEGRYKSTEGEVFDAVRRDTAALKQGEWEPRAPDGRRLHPVPTPEEKPAVLTSVYALSKYDQEQLSLIAGRAYDIPTVALRLFNVYGPRQSLNNPYTGVIAIFASRLLNDRSPLIYEDGEQRRDFVNVRDVATAFRLALEADDVRDEIINIGSGESRSVRQVAGTLAAVLERETIEPDITGRGRVGDVRHCFADISRARELLGYEPSVSFEEGVDELASWLSGRHAADRINRADSELSERGLTF